MKQTLTGIRWVGSWSIEEAGRSSEIGHGCVSVAVHAGCDGAVVGLLGGGAGCVAMGWYAACVTGEAWGWSPRNQRSIILFSFILEHLQ